MKSFGKQLTAWQIQTLYDVLLNRRIKNKPSVLCIENFAAMEDNYGGMFAEHLKQFEQIT
jgi:hypothetical protein